MNAGTLQKVAKDVTVLMEGNGFLLPDGSYDNTKLDTWEENLAFVAGLEAIGKKYGLNLPPKVGKAIQMLPLIVGIFD